MQASYMPFHSTLQAGHDGSLAGSETVVSIILSFFLAMTCYPEAQKMAQQEIDLVIGNDRLPTLADRPRLPLIVRMSFSSLVLQLIVSNSKVFVMKFVSPLSS